METWTECDRAKPRGARQRNATGEGEGERERSTRWPEEYQGGDALECHSSKTDRSWPSMAPPKLAEVAREGCNGDADAARAKQSKKVVVGGQ